MLQAVIVAATTAARLAAFAFAVIFAFGLLSAAPAGVGVTLGVLASAAVLSVVVAAAGWLVAAVVTVVFGALPLALLQLAGRTIWITETAGAVGGFLVGCLIWLAMWLDSTDGAAVIGWWPSIILVGGAAGAAGGRAFAAAIRSMAGNGR